jgi:hypothetical protein
MQTINDKVNFSKIEEDIIDYWKSNTENFPDVAMGWNQFGLGQLQFGNTGSALDSWIRGVQERPHDFRLNYNTANLLLGCGQAEQAVRQRAEAEQRAVQAAENERKRIEAEQARLAAEEAARAANVAHRKAVNNTAAKALQAQGLTEAQAKAVVIAVAKGLVAGMAMEY